MDKPCGCGDPLSGAQLYTVGKPEHVWAKQMDRDFVVQTPEGLVKGETGDYLVRNAQGVRSVVKKQAFDEGYALVEVRRIV